MAVPTMPCAGCRHWVDGEWLYWHNTFALEQYLLAFHMHLHHTTLDPDDHRLCWYFFCSDCRAGAIAITNPANRELHDAVVAEGVAAGRLFRHQQDLPLLNGPGGVPRTPPGAHPLVDTASQTDGPYLYASHHTNDSRPQLLEPP